MKQNALTSAVADAVDAHFAASTDTRPKDTATPSASVAGDLFTEQATRLFVNQLWGIADPDEILRKAGLTRAALRQLEGDDEISAALETRQASVAATPWRIEPFDATVAPFLTAELAPIIQAVLAGAWTAVPYGYSVLELIYTQRDKGRIGLLGAFEKPFEWFRPMPDGRLLYLPMAAEPVEVDQQFKFAFTARRATYRNPYGEALLSRAYWPWFLRSAGWRAWARFLERSAAPLLLGKTPGDTTAMANALANAALSGSVAIGTQDEVSAIEPANAGAAFDLFQQAVDKRIQKLVLGQTLTSDIGKNGGSFAAAKVHNDVRADRKQADLRLLQPTLQRIVAALCALNFPGAKVPEIILGEERDLEVTRADRDAVLVSNGIVALTEKYILDRYDFERGDFTIPPPGSVKPPKASPVPTQASAHFSAGGPFTPGQNALELSIAQATAQAASPISAAALRKAIAASTGPDDLVERLAELYADAPPDAFRELMRQALFAADVMGYAHAQGGE